MRSVDRYLFRTHADVAASHNASGNLHFTLLLQYFANYLNQLREGDAYHFLLLLSAIIVLLLHFYY